MRPPNERRTPEAYGRMSQIQQRIVQAQQTPRMPPMQDYEDIYNTQMMQQQQQQLGKISFLFFVSCFVFPQFFPCNFFSLTSLKRKQTFFWSKTEKKPVLDQ
jgi:hypothetical protein